MVWTRQAGADRQQIREYIAQDNPTAALALDELISEKAGRLADHPGLGRPGRVTGTSEFVITWTGLLQGELKWGALLAAEAFILPSHQENFGIAVAEALAVGTPVLISDKVNIWREIEADNAGLVAADTLDGTVSLLERWLALSPEQQWEMGERAKTCFEARFEMRRATENLLAVIRAKIQGQAK